MLGRFVIVLVITACCCQCSRLPDEAASGAPDLMIPERFESNSKPILPIASELDLPAAALLLGDRLYHDVRLSGAQRISCATCHPDDGTGMIATSAAAEDSTSYYDIPSIFNTGEQFAYFWNGRAKNLEAVVRVSLQAENIMNAAWSEILPRLAANPEYVDLFQAAYPNLGIVEESAVDALTTYVRSLVTPNAAFDRRLNGENLSESAEAGFKLFSDYGCIRCHQGAGVGGNMYASFRGYLEARGSQRTTDYGRFNITNVEEDRYVFKVPSLRNVAVTAPYFHDGSAEDLSDAIEQMALHQLGRTLSRGEINQIASFLESLTGWRDGALLGGAQ